MTVDPDDLLVEAPDDVLYRDAYQWRRVRCGARSRFERAVIWLMSRRDRTL